uniref:Uncharacterized protein n=1 Tax=Anguilla anguilla TaxID=7936 RepID=A0A0E9W190_ANGAN
MSSRGLMTERERPRKEGVATFQTKMASAWIKSWEE